MAINYARTLQVLKDHYVLVPLEIYADNPFKSLVATMMSSRTNDDVTVLAAERLFKIADTPEKLSRLDEDRIEKLIYPVGFYHVKAKQLKKLSQQIVSEFRGTVPNTREELMTLPGIGRKTANLVLNRAFHIPAIAVDIHVHRITNLIGWVHTKTPQQTEFALIKTVPEKYWSEINRLFVSLGRQFRSHKKLEEFLETNNLIER